MKTCIARSLLCKSFQHIGSSKTPIHPFVGPLQLGTEPICFHANVGLPKKMISPNVKGPCCCLLLLPLLLLLLLLLLPVVACCWCCCLLLPVVGVFAVGGVVVVACCWCFFCCCWWWCCCWCCRCWCWCCCLLLVVVAANSICLMPLVHTCRAAGSSHGPPESFWTKGRRNRLCCDDAEINHRL